ncbi:MAG: TonB-dependent receptor [Shewanella sp.]|nr:TonB-dependent receptor [Shewanella sp.]
MDMQQKTFKKTALATSLSLALSATALAPVYAAEEQDIEVIAVKGIRGSLIKSTDLKRSASGVVDAITAEDIGKFPDSNLAESLQRITGVAIDRSNGEGSQVTIRGFGPQYNMVTLNGRAMPGAGDGSSRAFDFANLASESVSAVEVYKTGKANIASGGIGGTINIVTRKPLSDPGFKVSIGAKALHDTTNRVGDDVTPELSGLISWTDDKEMFGVSLTASHQVRHNAAVGAFVTDWRTSAWDGTVPNTPTTDKDGDKIVLNNPPAMGQLHALPSDIRYTIADRERTRDNAQLTLQFRPVDAFTATLDYTYSRQETLEKRAEQSIWMDSFKTDFTFDDELVKTPIIHSEDRRWQNPRDLGLALQEGNLLNENNSIGLNLSYEVSDDFSLTLDAHDSKAERSPNAAYGSWINVGLGANVVAGQTGIYNGGLPLMQIDFDDSTNPGLNPNGMLDAGDVGTAMLDRDEYSHETDITQIRLDGSYEFDNGGIDFGIEHRAMSSHTVQRDLMNEMGGWGIANPGELPDGFLSPVDYADEFDDYSTAGGWTQGFTGSASEVGAWAANKYGFGFGGIDAVSTDSLIEEDINAAYVQLNLSGELGDRPYNVVIGLRYERTDITSTSNTAIPTAMRWDSNNDFSVQPGAIADSNSVSIDSSYSHLLPNLDFDIEVIDDVIARFSYSKTISRPSYNDLSAAVIGLGGPTAPTILAGSLPGGASSGNPTLVPFESDNFDVSAEWYFDDASYASIGYYEKRVSNFIGNEPEVMNQYGLRDPSNGPRAAQAIADLEALGESVTDTTLFSMVAANDLGVDYYSQDATWFENNYTGIANSDDPLMDFETNAPVNNQDAKINGFEFAIQHFFGDTGFGAQANYTTVNGDVGYDISADPSEAQFALFGLSDTANLVLMYENFGFQTRIAYNWRDEFLSGTKGQDPVFTEAHQQIDLTISYQVFENFTVSLDGINITGEDYRTHARSEAQLWNLEQGGARYSLGARYTF